MRPGSSCVLAVVAALGGCYDVESVCVGADCAGEEGPPEIILDEDPGAPGDDADGDGLANDVDTDDDDDGIQDDVDVDVDGDDLLEEMPSDELVAASRLIAGMLCWLRFTCCVRECPRYCGLQGASDEDADVCTPTQVPAVLAELAQAAATGGAAIDAASWQAEGHTESPPADRSSVQCFALERGQVMRFVTLDEVVLPYFHGDAAIGEACFTRWDCTADARCEGLGMEPARPGTCGSRPRVGGRCAGAPPFCPAGTICTVTEDETLCERPREENDFCRVFTLGGERTDNCDTETWCDDSIHTPACRPNLAEGDPCDDPRQCHDFTCSPEAPVCAGRLEDFSAYERDLRDWCPQMFPTATPWPEDEQ